MKNKFTAVIVLAAGLCVSTGVAAKDLTGWFINTATGRANYHATYDGYDAGNEHGQAAILHAGYRTQFIGFEGGYTDLGSVSARAGDISGKLAVDGWTAGINAHFNPSHHWYVSIRGGAYGWKAHAKLSDGVEQLTGHTESLGWYAGAGTGFDLNRHWSIGAHFDFYQISKYEIDVDSRLFTVSAEYRF